MNRKTLKGLLLLVISGICLYAAIYIYALHSDAYIAAKKQLESSEKLKVVVGDIHSVQLPVFGNFRQSWSGSYETSSFVVEVVGNKQTILVSIEMEKVGGLWKMNRMKIAKR